MLERFSENQIESSKIERFVIENLTHYKDYMKYNYGKCITLCNPKRL